MSSSKIPQLLEKLRSVSQKYGFILSSKTRSGETHFNYGPCGAGLKQNLMKEWMNSVSAIEGISIIDVSSSNKNSLVSNEVDTCKVALSHYPYLLMLSNKHLPTGMLFQMTEKQNREKSSPETDRYFLEDSFKESLLLYHFVPPFSATRWIDYWQRLRLQWWRKLARHPSDFTVSEQTNNANGDNNESINIQYNYSWGSECIESITNHRNKPLVDLGMNSVDYYGKAGRKNMLPTILELKFHLDHGILAYLLDAYAEKKIKRNVRTVLQLHQRLVYYKVAVGVTYSATSMMEVQEVAAYTTSELLTAGIVTLNLCNLTSHLMQNIANCDYMGIPHVVLISEQTLVDGLVGLRNRDTTLSEQIHLTHLKNKLEKYIPCYMQNEMEQSMPDHVSREPSVLAEFSSVVAETQQYILPMDSTKLQETDVKTESHSSTYVLVNQGNDRYILVDSLSGETVDVTMGSTKSDGKQPIADLIGSSLHQPPDNNPVTDNGDEVYLVEENSSKDIPVYVTRNSLSNQGNNVSSMNIGAGDIEFHVSDTNSVHYVALAPNVNL